ncbi:415_t:CDS:1, partial [Racocetra fulgida]
SNILAKAEEKEDINILRENNNDTDLDNGDIVLSSASNIEANINNKNKFLVKSVFDAITKLNLQ